LISENKAVIGVHLGRLWDQTDFARRCSPDTALCRQISPVIAQTFPLAATPAAHRYLQERRNIGKVLLTIDA
jgi:NADPH:quinone reductase-like Zn-dependent oxidoreductase